MGDDPLNLGGLPTAAEAEGASSSASTTRRKKAELAAEKHEATLMRAKTAAAKEERMSKPAPAPMPAPAPEPVAPEVDRSALLDRIGRYRERFPGLKSRNKLSGKSSTEELEDELHFIEQQLGGSGGSNMGMNILVFAMAGVERVSQDVWNPLGLNLHGLGQVTRDNGDQFQDVVDELMIKYAAGQTMGPEMRLALALGTLMYTVHAANSGDPRMAQVMKAMSAAAPKSDKDL